MKTPTLVIHGALDYRVPDAQGLAYYNTLKARGVDARLLWFPDENHWVLKPRNSRLWYGEFFAWLKPHDPGREGQPRRPGPRRADCGGLRRQPPLRQRSRDDMDHDLPAYLRHPALRGDTLAFVCDDDLWSVSADGGIARRLTAGLGEPATPCFSPDGRWLAFVSRDEQHPEVYLMPSEGGSARRMTWLGPDVMVRGFTPEGHILFVTTHGQPFFRNYRAHTLDPAGGMPQLLPLGQVNHLAFGPGKAMVIGRNTADPARWKRYRGGTAGQLWIDATGNGEFRRMTELAGNITSPMWIGDRVYFLSDAEGVGNLYSVKPDGSAQTRHTDHDDFYARHAQTDGKRIVYQCGAQIFVFDPASDTTRQVPIRVPAHRTQAARKFVSAAENLGASSCTLPATASRWTCGASSSRSDCGKGPCARSAWPTARAIATASGWPTAARSLRSATRPARSACSFGRTARRASLPWDIGRAVAMRAAPRGTLVAVANHRNEVLVGDVETGAVTVIDKSDHGRTEDLAWSPDGAWLAYTSWADARHCAIKLFGVADQSATLVTQPEFRDYAPAFDPEGRYLYFLSLRTFDPVYDAVQFELSFPRAARPYLIALQAGAASPFDPPPKGLRHDDRRREDREREGKHEPGPVRVDLDGIARRVAAFPVPENKFGQIAGVASTASSGR